MYLEIQVTKEVWNIDTTLSYGISYFLWQYTDIYHDTG